MHAGRAIHLSVMASMPDAAAATAAGGDAVNMMDTATAAGGDAAAGAGLAFKNARGYTRRRRRLENPEPLTTWLDRLPQTPYGPPRSLDVAGACSACSACSVYAHGTAEAAVWRARAHWVAGDALGDASSDASSAAPAVDPDLPLDVVLVHRQPAHHLETSDKSASAVASDTTSNASGLHLGHPGWTLAELRRSATVLRGSCLVLDAASAAIVGVFLTTAADAAIGAVAVAGREHLEMCCRAGVYPQKRRRHWYGSFDTGGYRGLNWLDGVQRFACPTAATRQFVTAFLPRRDLPHVQAQMAAVFAGMQALERRHVPAIYARRLALARRARFPGIVPGLPLERLAATFVGVTLDFSCQPHNDSSVLGTTETIVWDRPPGTPDFGFAILEYNLLFEIDGACMLYMPGDVWHGTPVMPRDDHGTLGLVLMSKKAVLADTDTQRAANQRLQTEAVWQPP